MLQRLGSRVQRLELEKWAVQSGDLSAGLSAKSSTGKTVSLNLQPPKPFKNQREHPPPPSPKP